MPPSQLEDMTSRLATLEGRGQELRDTLPLVLAAATAGVAIPSEALERLVPGLDRSWQAVAEFASAFPVGWRVVSTASRSFAGRCARSLARCTSPATTS